MTSPIALSFSRIKMFRDCPKKFYHVSVAPKGSPDRINDTHSGAARKGSQAHRALEARVKYQRPLPSEFLNFEPYAAPVAAFALGADNVSVEVQWAFRRDLNECEWFDKAAWFRAQADVAIARGTRGLIVDWKTGKVYYDLLQLNINSVFMFLKNPNLEVIESRLIWLNHDDVTEHEVHRTDLEYILDEIMDAVDPIEYHNQIAHWPVKPGPHCAWCPANKHRMCDKAAKPFSSKWE